jgi:hypothetical protein
MTALRMLGLVVLAAICVGIFIGAYAYLQGLSAVKLAEEVASQLHSEVQYVIITGNSRENVRIDIPSGYILRFDSDNSQLVIDGIRMPEDGYSLSIEGPEIAAGEHVVSIALENNRILVSEVS